MAKKELIGVRVSEDAYATFQAMLFLEGVKSFQDLLQPILEDAAESWGARPEVQRALLARAEHQARQEGVLSNMSDSA